MRDAPDQPPRQVNGVVGYPIQPLATACFGPILLKNSFPRHP
jgi:hypothetical protein